MTTTLKRIPNNEIPTLIPMVTDSKKERALFQLVCSFDWMQWYKRNGIPYLLISNIAKVKDCQTSNFRYNYMNRHEEEIKHQVYIATHPLERHQIMGDHLKAQGPEETLKYIDPESKGDYLVEWEVAYKFLKASYNKLFMQEPEPETAAKTLTMKQELAALRKKIKDVEHKVEGNRVNVESLSHGLADTNQRLQKLALDTYQTVSQYCVNAKYVVSFRAEEELFNYTLKYVTEEKLPYKDIVIALGDVQRTEYEFPKEVITAALKNACEKGKLKARRFSGSTQINILHPSESLNSNRPVRPSVGVKSRF